MKRTPGFYVFLLLLGMLMIRPTYASSDYSPLFEEREGVVSVEAEHYLYQELEDIRKWQVTSPGRLPKSNSDGDAAHFAGASGNAYLEILPDTRRNHDEKLIHGENFSNEPGKLGVLHYKIYFHNLGRYYVWVRAFSTGSEDNGIHVGLDGKWVASGQRMQWCEGKNQWTWASKQRTAEEHCGVEQQIYFDIEAPGWHTVSFSMREDGFEFDKFVLSREYEKPEGAGPLETILDEANRNEDGYRLWLRFDPIADPAVRKAYWEGLQQVVIDGESPVLRTAGKELVDGLSGLLGRSVPLSDKAENKPGVMAGVLGQSKLVDQLISEQEAREIAPEGFLLVRKENQVVIAGRDDRGVLYGAFRLLQLLQRHESLDDLYVRDNPRVKLRMLNHWDNLDRTVERGYAGFSIWNWHQLPEYIDRRYTDYARANASIGINGTVVTNVNANALIFRPDYLEKVAALADVFRPYGIRIYLTARFSSPMELGGLETADPLDPAVQQWWKGKAEEIYELIPDFGGFLVKANSEGQPGPQNYDRSHADGANMLADALAPHGGVVMWRAFVYSNEEPEDRAKQAYNEFVPLDGQFRKNVLIQVKNGPIDFQPREPIHPLFGAMPQTPLMMEFQITKEYLGQGTHLVGLSKMYEEVLQTDTYVKGKGSTVGKVIDGSLHGHELTGMAGVANIGTARNWTGNLFGQADWYAFGRLAWDPILKSETIFEEWAEMTFTQEPEAVKKIVQLLARSHEICVRYMTPLGLHHIMAAGHHYGPGPWVSRMSRADWTSVYYHRADEEGLGFDRTATGSDALSRYHPDFQRQFADMDSCPPEFLLWFHHVPWDHELSTGRTLWEELCRQYYRGAREVSQLKEQWYSIREHIDGERFRQVAMHLDIQEKEAKWWRDACLTYFQTFSKMEVPADLEQPEHGLEYYRSLRYPYAPGIRPRW